MLSLGLLWKRAKLIQLFCPLISSFSCFSICFLTFRAGIQIPVGSLCKLFFRFEGRFYCSPCPFILILNWPIQKNISCSCNIRQKTALLKINKRILHIANFLNLPSNLLNNFSCPITRVSTESPRVIKIIFSDCPCC